MLQVPARIEQIGTETAFAVLARAKALEAQGRDIINLGIGQPDFRTPDHIVEAARQALADGHHGYTPAAGIPELREAVAAHIRRHVGAEVSPGTVLIVPGGKVTMFFAILIFGEPGAEILYPNPGFPIYESAIKPSPAPPRSPSRSMRKPASPSTRRRSWPASRPPPASSSSTAPPTPPVAPSPAPRSTGSSKGCSSSRTSRC